MVYSFKIGQVITLGGGIFQYANYKINVDNGRGSSWCVYRRYSDFVDLHKLICIEANDSVIALSIELPAKEVGLLYSASKSVSDKRKVDLEKYLKSLVEIDAKSLPKCLNKFIDNENNGVSGPQIQLGANKILKEAFLKTKYMKYNPVWSTKFCVLTKSGNLHVMKSMYDPTTKAVSNFTLSGDSLVITGRSNDMIIDLVQRNDAYNTFHLQFQNRDEFAGWMRAIADFTLEKGDDQVKGYKKAAPVQQEEKKTQDVKTTGTGNTKDELSNMYGL